MRLLRILALIAFVFAFTPSPAVAVTGFDSAYSGESAFLTISPGQTGAFQVFFSNTGTQTWTKGSDTQVDLAACLSDKVTCNAQDPADSTWNNGWLSSTRYATTTQATVAPGALATFSYNIKAPSNATAGTNRFNGDLVVAKTGDRIHPQGYYQDATIEAIGSVASPTPAPTATPGSTPFPSPPPPTATPAPTPNPNPLLCFDGTTDGGFNGVCTLIAGGATLNTIDQDTNPNNNYAGVYYANSNLSGQPLPAVNPSSVSFTYAASGEGTTASGGSPRVSIPIDEDGDGTTENYAFTDTLGCNNGSANNGTLALSDATCTISYPGESQPNWAAFVAAHPTWSVSDSVPFVIVDQPGMWTVTNVHLGE